MTSTKFRGYVDVLGTRGQELDFFPIKWLCTDGYLFNRALLLARRVLRQPHYTEMLTKCSTVPLKPPIDLTNPIKVRHYYICQSI